MTPSEQFGLPANLAVITLHRVLRRESPVLLVTHGEGDGGWQFLDGSDNPDINDAAVVGLRSVLDLDASLLELADLVLGWQAWRENPGMPWKRSPFAPR